MEYDPDAEPLDNIARGLFAISRSLDRLGLNGASTPMGAIELLSSEVKRIADSVEPCSPDNPAVYIGDSLVDIADAIRGEDNR